MRQYKKIESELKLQVYELGMYRGDEIWHTFADKLQKKLQRQLVCIEVNTRACKL